ncbi:MAG: hypothetical protein R6T98_14740, partial [Desulfatiglandales bacterium]
MKTTSIDFEFIKWRFWEPLRRNQEYRNEYAILYKEFFPSFESIEAFSKKWNIQYPIAPELEFEQIKNPAGVFIDRSISYYEDAVFVPFPWIIESPRSGYLPVIVNL